MFMVDSSRQIFSDIIGVDASIVEWTIGSGLLRNFCILALAFIFYSPASAHLLSAGSGTIQIQAERSTLLIGVPVTTTL